MGEAKRRRERQVQATTVYHHTTTLVTNLIWMAGVVKVEAGPLTVLHPHFGEITFAGLSIRRTCQDFPPVAWFTTRIAPPKCLTDPPMICRLPDGSEIDLIGKALSVTGEKVSREEVTTALRLQRVALGFRIAEVPVVPWPAHPGYATAEGRELNETAREWGDDPDDWYVSETPVDVMKIAEFWGARSRTHPRLTPVVSGYLGDIRRMVTMCREFPKTYIPPSWLTVEQAQQLARGLGIPSGIRGALPPGWTDQDPLDVKPQQRGQNDAEAFTHRSRRECAGRNWRYLALTGTCPRNRLGGHTEASDRTSRSINGRRIGVFNGGGNRGSERIAQRDVQSFPTNQACLYRCLPGDS